MSTRKETPTPDGGSALTSRSPTISTGSIIVVLLGLLLLNNFASPRRWLFSDRYPAGSHHEDRTVAKDVVATLLSTASPPGAQHITAALQGKTTSQPPSQRQLLHLHAARLKRATNAWRDTVYHQVWDLSNGSGVDERPACHEQCQFASPSGKKQNRHFGLIACDSTAFFGPQGFYFSVQVSNLAKEIATGKMVRLNRPDYGMSATSNDLPAGGLGPWRHTGNVTKLVLSGYDTVPLLAVVEAVATHSPWVTHIFATNADFPESAFPVSPVVRAIPLTTHSCKGRGDQSARIEATQKLWTESYTRDLASMHQAEKPLLVNFGVHPAKLAPDRFNASLAASTWRFAETVNMTGVSRKRNGLADVLERFHNYKFVASPAGLGPDCFRTWEAMMVGAIPLLRIDPDSRLLSLFEGLPVLIVNSWDEVSATLLEAAYTEFLTKIARNDYNLERLTMSYWRSQFT